MSSLKDIMDVDVEPLESQAYRRSREAAQQQAPSRPSIASSSETSSPPVDNEDNKGGNVPIKRRRSNRASHLTIHPSPSSAASSRPITTRRRSSAAGEGMDYQTRFQVEGSTQASASGSPQLSSRGSESAADLPVKYTPVTGRISRAKKGVPVHTCDICRPVKTFTRAEHLRRHQLSHQKPAYPCTFEDCERAFHRPDLLARHLHRHETQGEKAYKSGDPRSRTSSVASDSLTPPLKVDTPPQPPIAGASESSPSESITPRSSTATENQMAPAQGFSSIQGNFQAGNYPASGTSHKRSRSQALPEPDTYGALSPALGPSRLGSGNYDLSASNSFSDPSSHPRFDGLQYTEAPNTDYSYPATPQLQLLQIPEEPLMPGLSYTHENSPWCSSASSNCSTQSEGSRSARYWTHREDRSASTATLSDWPAPVGVPQWSHAMTSTPQDMRGPGFPESILDPYNDASYTTSPRMTPPGPRHLLDVPNAVGYYYETAVGTPTLPTYNKPFTQPFPASSPRFTDPRLDIDGRKKGLVGSPQLGTLSINTVITYPHPQQNLDIYLDSYFQYFHQFFPIIHRPTFDHNEDSLLTSAMAAIGTQYHATSEARVKGSELNESCRKGIDLRLNWSTHTMQAILLTEMFTRFRARKTTVRLTRHFEELYCRLLNCPFPNQAAASSQCSGDPQPELQNEWYQWIDNEARQRLLATCFMFDIHQSIYHEQARSKARRDDSNNELSLPCPESLWSANTPIEWQAQQSNSSSRSLHIVEQEISPQGVLDTSPFTQTLLVCSFAARLPKREDLNYPNEFIPNAPDINIENLMRYFPTSPLAHVYLALHHTPLHDLLAISGDTWVFSQKITPPSAFHEAQSRLRTWSSSLAAAQATNHACRILSSALSTGYGNALYSPTFEGLKTGSLCICDYWSLYVSALICWAFGNRYQTAVPISRSNSSSAIGAMDVDDNASTPVADPRPKALNYVDSMLGLSIEDLLTSKASYRGDTAGVIDAVRQRLEIESVGNKSSLLVDAIGVLKKIRVGGKGKWF